LNTSIFIILFKRYACVSFHTNKSNRVHFEYRWKEKKKKAKLKTKRVLLLTSSNFKKVRQQSSLLLKRWNFPIKYLVTSCHLNNGSHSSATSWKTLVSKSMLIDSLIKNNEKTGKSRAWRIFLINFIRFLDQSQI